MHERIIKILLIEDVPKFARLLRDMLQESSGISFEVEWS